MKEWITLNGKEQRRVLVISRIECGELTAAQAAGLLTLSVRQVRRLSRAFRQDGAAGLAHGNRGRPPSHALPVAVREQVVRLAQTTYAGCNDSHLTDLLAEREAIQVSRATVWRWRWSAGLRSPQRRRPPRHRSRRERLPQAGLLLQWDASLHPWLEDRGPRLTLVGAVDDATGEVAAAHFRQHEDAQGYLEVLRTILTTKGVPIALYRDRHGIFERREREPWTLEEELSGQRTPTQVGRALEELGIASIAAHSPQAKGRVERLWRTLQDRLVAELRLAKATSLEDAEQVLQAFLPRFNQRFAVPAAQPGSGYRPAPEALDIDTVCCFKYRRRVAPDNTVTLGPHRLQLRPTPQRASYARLSVEVHERLDGSLAVWYQGQCLATSPAPPTAPVLRARKATRVTPAPGLTLSRPPEAHPWRRYPRTNSLNT